MRRRDLAILAGVLVFACGMTLWLFFGTVLPTGSWGLSFRQEGAPPVAPAGSGELAKFDAAYLGDPEEKVIYLTFDSGYENGATSKILDALKKHKAPGAFFLAGNYLERNADLVRRMVEEGHIVGNHTMHHYDMSKLSDSEVFAGELAGVEELFRQITGKELPKYYRPPQGIYSQQNLEQAKELGYRTVFWSLAYVDWNNDDQPEPREALDKLTKRIHNGAVVLLHSTSQTNGEILDELLTRWEELGYRFGSLEELF